MSSFLVSCAGASTESVGWEQNQSPTGFRHKWSGLVFPSKIEDLQQMRPTDFAADGHNSAVSYNGPQHDLAITLYVYPKPTMDMKNILAYEIKTIQFVHPAVKIGMMGAMKMPLGQRESAQGCVGAYLVYEENNTAKGSLLVLIPIEDKLFKVRATWRQNDEALKYGMARVQSTLRAVTPPSN